LAKLPEVDQVVDWQNGTFNTPLFRIFALVAICALQAWLMLNFITFQLKKRREDAANNPEKVSGGKKGKTQQEKAQKRKEKPKKEKQDDEDESELTEVDQNTKQSLRQRK
jgi:flagellar biosynthesis/type III secretory pathway M-ring protein FliF/YscJ